MRWNRKTILDEIRELHRRGEDLSFGAAEENHLNLVRAATWHYGTWKGAIELAGFDYEAVSRYRRWSREMVLQAIRDHYAAGHDLSWRSVSTILDQPLAAAALRPGVGFETWREAVSAAGINHEEVARYRHWTPERVLEEITAIAQKNEPLSSKIVQNGNQPLYCAARRRFKSWNGALEAAGIDPQTVRLRRAPRENLSLDPQFQAADNFQADNSPIVPENDAASNPREVDNSKESALQTTLKKGKLRLDEPKKPRKSKKKAEKKLKKQRKLEARALESVLESVSTGRTSD